MYGAIRPLQSWHGLSRGYEPKTSRYRKSLATYYVSNPRADALTNTRAFFAPRVEQLQDKAVLEQIQARVSEKGHQKVYVVK